MGHRFVLERMEKAHVRFTEMWIYPHIGRYYKRKLSKARRRSWKEQSDKHLVSWESECNWKGWQDGVDYEQEKIIENNWQT